MHNICCGNKLNETKLLYVPHSLTLQISAFYQHCIHVFLMTYTVNSDHITKSINRLALIRAMQCDTRTEFLKSYL